MTKKQGWTCHFHDAAVTLKSVEYSSEVLIRVSQFIDELLVSLYKQKAFYNIKTKEDW